MSPTPDIVDQLPLHVLSGSDSFIALQKVKTILETGERSANDREPDMQLTPLHIAASWGNLAMAQLLLLFGANAMAIDDDGHRPIDLAEDRKVRRVLLQHMGSSDKAAAKKTTFKTFLGSIFKRRGSKDHPIQRRNTGAGEPGDRPCLDDTLEASGMGRRPVSCMSLKHAGKAVKKKSSVVKAEFRKPSDADIVRLFENLGLSDDDDQHQKRSRSKSKSPARNGNFVTQRRHKRTSPVVVGGTRSPARTTKSPGRSPIRTKTTRSPAKSPNATPRAPATTRRPAKSPNATPRPPTATRSPARPKTTPKTPATTKTPLKPPPSKNTAATTPATKNTSAKTPAIRKSPAKTPRTPVKAASPKPPTPIPRQTKKPSAPPIEEELDIEVAEVSAEILALPLGQLKHRLKLSGVALGPLTSSNRSLYEKRLAAAEQDQSKAYSPGKKYSQALERLVYSLGYNNWTTRIGELQEDMVRNAYCLGPVISRERNEVSSFCYLLIDPSDIADQRACSIGTFLNSIFYIGKGKRGRPLQHLVDASKARQPQGSKKRPMTEKLKRIDKLWRKGVGVISLQVFTNIHPNEAFVREAAMIDAFGLGNLTNLKSGEYKLPANTWSMTEKTEFGAFCLYSAWCVFKHERCRPIFETDVAQAVDGRIFYY